MGVSLRCLEARFVRHTSPQGSYAIEPTIESADGICFVCPLCWLALKDSNYDPNVGVRGVHHVLCWRPRVPAGVSPGPGRWDLHGTGLNDVTLVAGSSSIHLQGGCGWHGYVRNGECVDDLGPESVERARKYHADWRQSVIDREIAMTGTSTSDAAPSAPSPAPDAPAGATTAPPGATVATDQGGPVTDTGDTEGLTREVHDVAAADLTGYFKTMDLRVHEGLLEQRWVSGHDSTLSAWVAVEGQRL